MALEQGCDELQTRLQNCRGRQPVLPGHRSGLDQLSGRHRTKETILKFR